MQGAQALLKRRRMLFRQTGTTRMRPQRDASSLASHGLAGFERFTERIEQVGQ